MIAEWSSLGWKLCWRELSWCRYHLFFPCKKYLNLHWTSEIRSHYLFAHTPPNIFLFHPMLVLQGFFLFYFSCLLLGCRSICSFIQNEFIQIENIQFGYIKIGYVQIEYIQFWFNKQVVHIILFLPFLEWPVVFTCFKCSLITLLGPILSPSYSIEPFSSTNIPWEQHNKSVAFPLVVLF